MTKDEYERIWDKLAGAFGPPAGRMVRYKGLYEELKHVSYGDCLAAAQEWIEGKTGSAYSGRRFPYPADLLEVVRRIQQQRARRRERAPANPKDSWEQMSDKELIRYLQKLTEASEQLLGKDRGRLKLMDATLYRFIAGQYSMAKHELERRRPR